GSQAADGDDGGELQEDVEGRPRRRCRLHRVAEEVTVLVRRVLAGLGGPGAGTGGGPMKPRVVLATVLSIWAMAVLTAAQTSPPAPPASAARPAAAAVAPGAR